MLPRETLEALGEAAGEGGLEEHAPVQVDGVAIEVTLRPEDGAALARTLEALGRTGVSALVRGGGSRLGLGNPPRAADVFLCVERLAGVDEFDAADGVCHAAAGTALAEVRETVAARGWELPLDPPGERASVGGTLASAAVGPRALGFGLPRDAVLGLEVVLANGERTRCGGRVVKNVSGYDLGKLYTGSLGTLGVIEGAWLRLRPRPATTRVLEMGFPQLAEACAAGIAAARRDSALAAALAVPAELNREAFDLLLELAGDEPSVARDADWLVEMLSAEPAAPGALDRVRALQASTLGEPGKPGLRFRISTLPSRVEAVLGALRAAGATLLAYPGLGLCYAGFPLAEDDTRALERGFGSVAAATREAGGSWILEEGPPRAKQGCDVFGDPSDALPLMRALKSRFDPGGVLNAGRFMGLL
jgi:glycolate oxidase FAD binding subunit